MLQLITSIKHLQGEKEHGRRDRYRRILTRVVQAADRIPWELWIDVDSSVAHGKDMQKIGYGSYGTVYQGWLKQSNKGERERVAIKRPNTWNDTSSTMERRMVSPKFEL